MQWRPLPPNKGGLIQLDISGHPSIPLAQKQLFQFGSFSTIFRVLNFQGHFEALNENFLASQLSRYSSPGPFEWSLEQPKRRSHAKVMPPGS